jgi:glycosyltransferase involved in cell wall biosynthesis
MRIVLLYRRLDLPVDGIRDYALNLAGELDLRPGLDAQLLEVDPAARSLPRSLAGADVVAIQYLPSCWGRGGLAPWLPLAIWRLRLRKRRPLIALFVHEPFVPSHYLVLRIWQRVQLRLMHAMADLVYGTMPAVTKGLAKLRPRRRTLHIPVGSNVPDRSADRDQTRAELGLGDGQLAIALFGMSAGRRQIDYIEAALDALEAAGDLVVLNLGHRAPAVRASPRREVRTPGSLPAAELGRLLAASDLALMPWRDGASTVHTTLMAALQNAVPVLSTRGPATDLSLLNDPDALALTSRSDLSLFAETALALARDPERRRALGRSGKRLYAQRFDWSVLAEVLIADWTDERTSTACRPLRP